MAFSLQTGQYDLGEGSVSLGNVLGGVPYSIGTSTTGVQGLLNTSGLEGISNTDTGAGGSYADIVFFRPSNDALTGAITFTNGGGGSNGDSTVWCFLRDQVTTYLSSQARFFLAPNVGRTDGTGDDVAFSHLNSGLYVSPLVHSNNQNFRTLFRPAANWRFLARDHATALTHYPASEVEGSIFAASCINSPTQWGFWAAGEVGNRSIYFNQIQGYFSIVLMVNGGTSYFSVFSPTGENSTGRNDTILRNYNIIPAAGQSTTNDKISELVLLRDQGTYFNTPLGTVPGLFYVDPNKVGFDDLEVGSLLTIVPDPLATYEGVTNAIIVARWGADMALTASNTGNLLTITSASPNRLSLENGVRIRIPNTGNKPNGTSFDTDYWVTNWNSTAFTFNLSATEGGSAVTLSSDVTGINLTRKAALIAMRCA